MLFAYLFSILAFSIILFKSADLVIVSVKRISHRMRIGIFVVSAIIIAVGTSLPELLVGVSSALEGVSKLSLGVVLGSNISNIALIGSLAAFITGRVRITGKYVRNEVILAILAGAIPVLLALDRNLSKLDGAILVGLYAFYIAGFFKKRFMEMVRERKKGSFIPRFFVRVNHVDGKIFIEAIKLITGIGLLVFSAHYLVRISHIFAETVGVPVFIIGLLVIAVGTSLPEFAFSLESLKNHEPTMFFGNIFGSIIINSTLIIGITVLISPIKNIDITEYVPALSFYLVTFIVFWIFVRTKNALDRWEAAVLILIYIIFVAVEFV